jgi:hypothetical protein
MAVEDGMGIPVCLGTTSGRTDYTFCYYDMEHYYYEYQQGDSY